MTKVNISTNAQSIMSVLNGKGAKDYEQVRQRVHLSEREMGAAIGWLLRENSIVVEGEADSDNCTISEKNIPYGIYY
jgi:hypothetical protein